VKAVHLRRGTGRRWQPHTVDLGLLVTPALDDDVARGLAEDVEQELARRYPGVEWQIAAVRDLLVPPPARLAEVFDAARMRLLDRNWDLAVHVTELPLRVSHRPVVTHTSRTHGVAIVSLPALGLKQSRRHLVQTIADAVGMFVGDYTDPDGPVRLSDAGRIQRRWVELASDIDAADALADAALLLRVVTGNVRLLIGMVRANHPWRLATSLSRTLVGAVGVGTGGPHGSRASRRVLVWVAASLAGVAVGAFAGAQRPVIYAGQGVHYAKAWASLRELAELLEAPVTTTLCWGARSMTMPVVDEYPAKLWPPLRATMPISCVRANAITSATSSGP